MQLRREKETAQRCVVLVFLTPSLDVAPAISVLFRLFVPLSLAPAPAVVERIS